MPASNSALSAHSTKSCLNLFGAAASALVWHTVRPLRALQGNRWGGKSALNRVRNAGQAFLTTSWVSNFIWGISYHELDLYKSLKNCTYQVRGYCELGHWRNKFSQKSTLLKKTSWWFRLQLVWTWNFTCSPTWNCIRGISDNLKGINRMNFECWAFTLLCSYNVAISATASNGSFHHISFM